MFKFKSEHELTTKITKKTNEAIGTAEIALDYYLISLVMPFPGSGWHKL